MDSFNDFYLLRSVVLSLSLWHTKTPHFLNSIPYCLTNGGHFIWSIGGFFVYLRYSRTAVLALALINQVLSSLGKPLLPIESAQLEQLISTGFTTVSALVNWWFNNSFTKEAIQADAEFERLRKSVK